MDFQEIPAAFPPSFNPANILEATLHGIKAVRTLKQNIDPERIRGDIRQIVDEAMQHRDQ